VAHEGGVQTVPLTYLRQPPLPSQVPSVPQVEAALCAHCPPSALPAGTLVHVPALPGTAQERQRPVHAVWQQTPCWQKPEKQSSFVPQVAPAGALPQLRAVQTLPELHWASVVQVVRQVPSVPHAKGVQGSPEAGTQAPCPSQREACVRVAPMQVCGWQVMPAGYSRQLPAPLQAPSRPQLEMPSSGHSLRGSVPGSAATQVPTESADAQVRQMPEQSVLQQTPSKQ
jgi:hypothetical protein